MLKFEIHSFFLYLEGGCDAVSTSLYIYVEQSESMFCGDFYIRNIFHINLNLCPAYIGY